MSNLTAGTPDFAPSQSPGGFGATFWILNSIEMLERLAYYTLRVMAPIYIMQAENPGGLHLTAQDKGLIYASWALFQSLLPMVTGGFVDRYGYKPMMACSITVMFIGYIAVALFRDIPFLPALIDANGIEVMSAVQRSNFWGLFVSIMLLASGTALFKPSIQGTLAQILTRERASMGWGIFYWVVNVGAFIGHYVPNVIFMIVGGGEKTTEAWRNLFLMSAAFMACNYVLLFMYKDLPTGSRKDASILSVLGTTISNIWPYWFLGGKPHIVRIIIGLVMMGVGVQSLLQPESLLGDMVHQSYPIAFTVAASALIALGIFFTTWLEDGVFTWQLRLPIWILIMSGFWMMMYQLWDLGPNFITDWTDSTSIVNGLTALPEWLFGAFTESTPRGLQIPQEIFLSINSLLIIFFVVGIAYLTRKMRTLSAMIGGMILATIGILVFGLTMSPWILILGILFFSLGEMSTGPKKNEYLAIIAPPGKKGLYLGYVNIPVGVGVFFGSLLAGELYGNFGEKATLALRYLVEKTTLGKGAKWEFDTPKMEQLLGITRSEAMEKVVEITQSDHAAATRMLWETYSPQYPVWLPFAAIGVVSTIALIIFAQMAKRWKDMNA